MSVFVDMAHVCGENTFVQPFTDLNVASEGSATMSYGQMCQTEILENIFKPVVCGLDNETNNPIRFIERTGGVFHFSMLI